MLTYVAGAVILASDLNSNFSEVVADLKSGHHRKAGYTKITQADIGASLALLTTGVQSITGIKTFGSIPVLPASDPTTDNQAVRKKYVDDKPTSAYVGDLGSTTSGLVSSTQSFTLTASCGFTPGLFEAVVSLDKARGKEFSSGDNANVYFLSAYIKGIVGGAISFCYVTDEQLLHPNDWDSLSPFMGMGGIFDAPLAYGAGTCASPGLSVDNDGKFELASITVNGNDLEFNFTFTYDRDSNDCRYAVRMLNVAT